MAGMAAATAAAEDPAAAEAEAEDEDVPRCSGDSERAGTRLAFAGGPRPLIAGEGGDPIGTGDAASLPLDPACLIADCWLLCLRSLLSRPPPLPPLGFARGREEGVVLEGRRGRGSSVSEGALSSSSLSVALVSAAEGVTERKVWALAGRGAGGGTAGGRCAEDAAEDAASGTPPLGTGDARGRGSGATLAGESAVTNPTADLLRGAAGAVAAAGATAEGTAATGAGAGATLDSTDALDRAKLVPSDPALVLLAGAACIVCPCAGFGGVTLALMSAAMDARRLFDSSSLLSSSSEEELRDCRGCVSCCDAPPSPPFWLLS